MLSDVEKGNNLMLTRLTQWQYWSQVAGMADLWTYMHKLLLPKLVIVTSGEIFVQEFCYTSGNQGSIWTNFCSPSKTTKLVQISIGLPERASKKMQLLKEPLSTWTLSNF